MPTPAAQMIRELWPLVRALRRQGVSWRKMPGRMHELAGVPQVSHALYLREARKLDDPLSAS